MRNQKHAMEQLRLLQDQVEFDRFRHQYSAGGKTLRSVTTVNSVLNKPALLYWASKVQREVSIEHLRAGGSPHDLPRPGAFREVSAAAADRGTDIHALCEGWSLYQMGKGDAPEGESPLEKEALANFISEYERHQIVPLFPEGRIWLKDLGVSGTFDLLAIKDGKLAMVDLKTGKTPRKVYAEHRLQQAAYREGLYRLGFPQMESWIMSINRDTAKIVWFELPLDHKADFRAFEHLAHVAEWMDAYEKEDDDD